MCLNRKFGQIKAEEIVNQLETVEIDGKTYCIGYKYMVQYPKALFEDALFFPLTFLGCFFGKDAGKAIAIRRNEWIEAEIIRHQMHNIFGGRPYETKYLPLTYEPGDYPAGFHVLVNEKATCEFTHYNNTGPRTTVRVIFQKEEILAVGTEEDDEGRDQIVLVVQKMMILN